MIARTLGLLLLFLVVAAGAEARLELPNPLVPDVTVEGKLVIDNAPGRVVDVKLPHDERLQWQILRGGMQSTSIVNGVVSKSETIRVSVRVSGAGPIEIGPVTITFSDSSQLKTPTLSIGVNQGNTGLTGDSQAEISFEPASIVPGESTNVVYKLYLRGQANATNISVPDVANAISLGEKQLTTGETIDGHGITWRVITVRWPITFAEPGAKNVGGQISFVTEVDSWPFPERVRKQVAAKPGTLTVEPMPTQGRPDDFGGLIGPIGVQAKLSRERISSGEGATLEVTVQGRQVDLLQRPTLPAMAGMQSYPRETDASGRAGTRTFTWDLVPSAPGDFTIPPFSFSYFDPSTRSYNRAETAPQRLQVLPGHNRELSIVGNTAKPMTPTAAAPAAPEMPSPLHGAAPSVPQRTWPWLALAASTAVGAVAGLTNRFAGRWRRAQHRGRALSAAVRRNDPVAIAHALQALAPALTTDAERGAARKLTEAVEVARFGGSPLDPVLAKQCAAALENVA